MARFKTIFLLVILVAVLAASCGAPAVAPTPTRTPPAGPTGVVTTPPVVAPTSAAPASAPGQPTATPLGPYGPTGFPADVNPLTGLPVSDPNILNRRPLLVKISNESDQVRPQSGWSFADHVWEYQMEGFAQTRYSAIFYGQTPQHTGSVRSARMPDVEHLVDMYGAILVYSGASSNFRHTPPGPPRIRELINMASWRNRAFSPDNGYAEPYLVRIPDVPHPGIASWHTLHAVPSEIWRWAGEQNLNQRPNLDGLAFAAAVPAGGAPTNEAVIDYPGTGPKHTWRWDAATGRWLSFTNDVADQDYLAPDVQLAFDNVVILKVPTYETDFLEQEGELGELYGVGLTLTGEGAATLLRDGQRWEIKWRRIGTAGMLQFVDAAGAVVYLKPGTIFFQVASSTFHPPAITLTP